MNDREPTLLPPPPSDWPKRERHPIDELVPAILLVLFLAICVGIVASGVTQ